MRCVFSLVTLSLCISLWVNPKLVVAYDCSGPSPKLWEASQEAATRILKNIAEGRDPNSGDQRLVEAAKQACSVGNVKVVTESTEYTKSVRKDLVGDAHSAADRLLAKYNGSDGDFTFSGEDMRLVRAFQQIIVALEIIHRTSPQASKKPEIAQDGAARAAADRIVAAFNVRGWSTIFSPDDLELLRKFAKATGSQ